MGLGMFRRVPRPPTRRPEDAPGPVRKEPGGLWRLHWARDPRKPAPRSSATARFDAPWGEYPVIYANADPDGYACFAEVYGDQRSIAPNQAGRRLSVLRAKRPLRVITLDHGKTLAAFRLDLSISSSADYERTMLWSKSLHDWYHDADGIRYLGRRATRKLNYCLFLDRCGAQLSFETKGTLAELSDHVHGAADAYSLAPRLFEGRDPGSQL